MHKELYGYPNYGLNDGAADILYTRQAATWHFTVPSNIDLSKVQRAFFNVSIVADDHTTSLSSYNIVVWVNGVSIFNGTSNLPHGSPAGGRFTNWVHQPYPLIPSSYSNNVTIQNLCSSCSSGDWIAVDWIELELDFALRSSAPQGLTATAGPAKVTLAWSTPSSNGGSSIAGYKVYRGSVPSGEALLITVGNQTSYNDVAVAPRTSYYYKVTAYNTVGESIFSNEASATTTPAPSSPRNLVAQGGSGQITLTWNVPSSNGGSPITGYTIYRGSTSSSETLLSNTGNQTVYSDTSLNAGQTYYYEVTAVSAAGTGSFSNEATATTSSSGGGGGSGGSGGAGASPSFPPQTLVYALVLSIIAALAVIGLIFRRRKAKEPPS